MVALLSSTADDLYEQTTLANGLRVVTATMPHTRSAAVQIYIGVGARHESARLSGISHFVEHMVFKGTERRPNPVQISEAIEGVGGSMDASTDHEQTNYRALVPSSYLGTALDVLIDMLRAPRFTPDDIERERAVIIEELSSTLDSPTDMVDLLFDEMLWGAHPLGRDVGGSMKTVKRISRADMTSHVAEHYRPDAIVVSVAGNVTHQAVVREVERLLGDLPSGVATNGHLSEPAEPDGPRVKLRKKRTEQINLILGVPAFPYTHPHRFTQDVLDTLLGGGMSSRLFVGLRENLGLAYSVSSFVKTYEDVGALGVHAAVDNDSIAPAVRAIIAEFQRVKDEPVPDAELRKVKEYIKGHTVLSMERSGYVAHWAGWQELMLGRIESVDEALEKIEAVTARDVQALAATLFDTQRLQLALVGPTMDTDELASHLRLQ